MPTGAEQEEKPRARGLPSIQQAREGRAEGRARMPAPKFWAYAGLVLAIGFILRWKWSDAEIEHTKAQLLANQRAAVATFGPLWDGQGLDAGVAGHPLRNRIEAWVTALAKDPGPEVIERETLAKWDFRTRPGIYLRLLVDEAKTPEDIRKGARNSLRDGFTACLNIPGNPNPLAGKACKKNHDCAHRETCNEQDHCSLLAQPFNLRVAYQTLHILSPEWRSEVEADDSDLRIRLFVKSYEDARDDDLPLAAELLQKAQYFLVVLDETPPGTPTQRRDARRGGAGHAALRPRRGVPARGQQGAPAREARVGRRAHRRDAAGRLRRARGADAAGAQLRPRWQPARRDGRHRGRRRASDVITGPTPPRRAARRRARR